MAETGLRDVKTVAGSSDALGKLSARNPFFVCVISHTATAEIPGLTVAGANPEMVKYTPAADAEFLHYGHCKCIPSVPATPDGKPTPALITRAALLAAGIPFLVADAGARVRPAVPAVSMGVSGPGGNIALQDAMPEKDVETALAFGRALGRQLAMASDLVVIGESIPGGTTTALAVLSALGLDARFKVSSSMPDNPHELKNRVVGAALQRAAPQDTAARCVARLGDPMMPAVAGIAWGALEAGGRAMLAGGTQMAAVLAVMKAAMNRPLDSICVGTTAYVADDRSADLAGLVRAIAPEVPVLASDLHLGQSQKPGLRAFAQGFVKEGVGAGGASIAAMMKNKKEMDGKKLLELVEREYESSIERPLAKR